MLSPKGQNLGKFHDVGSSFSVSARFWLVHSFLVLFVQQYFWESVQVTRESMLSKSSVEISCFGEEGWQKCEPKNGDKNLNYNNTSGKIKQDDVRKNDFWGSGRKTNYVPSCFLPLSFLVPWTLFWNTEVGHRNRLQFVFLPSINTGLDYSLQLLPSPNIVIAGQSYIPKILWVSPGIPLSTGDRVGPTVMSTHFFWVSNSLNLSWTIPIFPFTK